MHEKPIFKNWYKKRLLTWIFTLTGCVTIWKILRTSGPESNKSFWSNFDSLDGSRDFTNLWFQPFLCSSKFSSKFCLKFFYIYNVLVIYSLIYNFSILNWQYIFSNCKNNIVSESLWFLKIGFKTHICLLNLTGQFWDICFHFSTSIFQVRIFSAQIFYDFHLCRIWWFQFLNRGHW